MYINSKSIGERLRQLILTSSASEHLFSWLELLIETEEEYTEFVETFLPKNNTIASLIMRYRAHKIKKLNISYDEFIKLYTSDRINALQILFQERIHDFLLDMLDKRLSSGDTIEMLFELHKFEPNKRFGRFIDGGSLKDRLDRIRSKINESNNMVVGKVFSEDEVYVESEKYNNEWLKSIESSRKDSKEKRLLRLNSAKKKPDIVKTITLQYKRNPDVVIEVLERANGICEGCNNTAPFLRVSDGTPYLEVHHKIPLSQNGDDTVENAIALCPNCHAKMHFGR